MLTIHDLLEDPIYKDYFLKVPRLPVTSPDAQPWRLYIKLKSNERWARKDFASYAQAFKYFNRKRKEGEVLDAAINCRRASFGPPTRFAKVRGKFIKGSDGVTRQATKVVEWQPTLDLDSPEDIRWCPWCRRPVSFRYYAKHRALSTMSGLSTDPSVKRCDICGASERIANYGRGSSAASAQIASRRKKTK